MRSKTKKKNKNKRKQKFRGIILVFGWKNIGSRSFFKFLVLIVVAIGVGYLTFGNESVPAPLRHLNYITPLYVNLVLLVLIPYILDLVVRKRFTSLKVLAEGFLYLNGPVFLIHYFIGIRSKGGNILPTSNQFGFSLCLVSDCNLYPIFSIAGLATLIAIYLERKKKCHVPKNNPNNICLVEDKARGKVLMQYRSPERYRWSGYAFSGWSY